MTNVIEHKRIGRPRSTLSAEDLLAKRREQQRLNATNRSALTMDKAMVAELRAVSERLGVELGFTPSLTQTIRLLIKRAGI